MFMITYVVGCRYIRPVFVFCAARSVDASRLVPQEQWHMPVVVMDKKALQRAYGPSLGQQHIFEEFLCSPRKLKEIEESRRQRHTLSKL